MKAEEPGDRVGSVYAYARPEMLQFLPSTAQQILDVGAANGDFGITLKGARPNVTLWGVEPDPKAKASVVYDEFIRGGFPDVVPRLPSGSFDAIFFNDVLEHLIDPSGALDAARQLLRPSGVLIASIPNVRHISVVVPLVFRGQWTYAETGLLDRTHVHFFTRRSAERLFSDGGWVVEAIKPISRWYPKLRWLSVADDFFTVQYAFLARPRQSST